MWQIIAPTSDDKRSVEQEVNKSVMVVQQAVALSPPHVYYSRPLVGPRLALTVMDSFY